MKGGGRSSSPLLSSALPTAAAAVDHYFTVAAVSADDVDDIASGSSETVSAIDTAASAQLLSASFTSSTSAADGRDAALVDASPPSFPPPLHSVAVDSSSRSTALDLSRPSPLSSPSPSLATAVRRQRSMSLPGNDGAEELNGQGERRHDVESRDSTGNAVSATKACDPASLHSTGQSQSPLAQVRSKPRSASTTASFAAAAPILFNTTSAADGTASTASTSTSVSTLTSTTQVKSTGSQATAVRTPLRTRQAPRHMPRTESELQEAIESLFIENAALRTRNEKAEASLSAAEEDLAVVRTMLEAESQIRLLLERQESSLKETLHAVIAELDRTKLELVGALAAREDALDARQSIENDIEDLTQTLFEEANTLVSVEARKAHEFALEKDQLARELAETQRRLLIDQAVLMSLQRRIQLDRTIAVGSSDVASTVGDHRVHSRSHRPTTHVTSGRSQNKSTESFAISDAAQLQKQRHQYLDTISSPHGANHSFGGLDLRSRPRRGRKPSSKIEDEQMVNVDDSSPGRLSDLIPESARFALNATAPGDLVHGGSFLSDLTDDDVVDLHDPGLVERLNEMSNTQSRGAETSAGHVSAGDIRFNTLPRGFQLPAGISKYYGNDAQSDEVIRGRTAATVTRYSDAVPAALKNYASPSPDGDRARSPVRSDPSSVPPSWSHSSDGAPHRAHSDEFFDSDSFPSPGRSETDDMALTHASAEASMKGIAGMPNSMHLYSSPQLEASFREEERLFSEVVRFVLSAEVAACTLARFAATVAMLDPADSSIVRLAFTPIIRTPNERAKMFSPEGVLSFADAQDVSVRALLRRLIKEDLRPGLAFCGPIELEVWRLLDYEASVPAAVRQRAKSSAVWPFGDREARAAVLAHAAFVNRQVENAAVLRKEVYEFLQGLLPALEGNHVTVEPIPSSTRAAILQQPCELCSAHLPLQFATMRLPAVPYDNSATRLSQADVERALERQRLHVIRACANIRPRAFVVKIEPFGEMREPFAPRFCCRWCRQRLVAASNIFGFWRNIRRGVMGNVETKGVYLQFLVLRMHLAHTRIVATQ